MKGKLKEKEIERASWQQDARWEMPLWCPAGGCGLLCLLSNCRKSLCLSQSPHNNTFTACSYYRDLTTDCSVWHAFLTVPSQRRVCHIRTDKNSKLLLSHVRYVQLVRSSILVDHQKCPSGHFVYCLQIDLTGFCNYFRGDYLFHMNLCEGNHTERFFEKKAMMENHP